MVIQLFADTAGKAMKNFVIWVILMGAIGYGGAKLYLHNEVGDAMDMVVLMMAPYADVEYSGVGSTLSGELTVEGVRVRIEGYRDEIYIEKIGISTPSFFSLIELSDLATMQGDAMPEYFGFLIEGLHIPTKADYYEDFYAMALEAKGVSDADSPANECSGKYGFSPHALQALGYREQVLSVSMTVRDEESRYSFDMLIDMADMWEMDASIALAGNMVTEMSKGATYRPKLQDMRVKFTDQSMNQRVTDYCGELGLTPAETLRAQIDSFKYAGESNGIEFDQYMLDPYKEFLLGKSTLIVTARPSDPVAFSQLDLYKPSDVPALLNLAAVAR